MLSANNYVTMTSQLHETYDIVIVHYKCPETHSDTFVKTDSNIVVGFGKKKHLKKAPLAREKKHIFSKKKKKKKAPFCKQKALLECLVNINLLIKTNKKVLTIKLFNLFFICIIKFLRARCKYCVRNDLH